MPQPISGLPEIGNLVRKSAKADLRRRGIQLFGKVLDRPPEPVIGPRFARTRWRAMTGAG
jgi:hypothetical protein